MNVPATASFSGLVATAQDKSQWEKICKGPFLIGTD